MDFLNELVIVFCLSIVVLLLCHRFRIPSIVGFLLTGVLCGPTALSLVGDLHTVDLLAEIGVVLLLFTIGMEMSGEELKRLKKPIGIGGGTQVFITITMTFLFAFLFTGNAIQGIFLGFLVALSSTAIVLSLLQQKAQTDSPQGRLCLAILIFQDIAIVPMMLAIPLIAGSMHTDMQTLLLDLGRDFLIIGGIVLFGAYVLPHLMRQIMRTRSRDLLLLATLGITFAIALLTSYAGLSLSLGAFLAGVLLAESEYSLSVLENILPFKDVFTSVFFISVGMLLDVPFFFNNILLVLAIAVLLIVIKMSVVYPSVRLLKYSPKTAILVAFSLAQIGEFSFVLARSGMEHGLMQQNEYQLFLAASILTMTFTPVFMALAPKAADIVIKKFYAHQEIKSDDEEELHESLKDHLLIVGFGVGGKGLAKVAKEAQIPYSILEANPDTVAKYRASEPIKHGDASLPLILQHAGIEQARALAILTPDPAATRAIIATARKLNPLLFIVARTRFLSETTVLHDLGANRVIAEEFEASIGVFAYILDYYLLPQQKTQELIFNIRNDNYATFSTSDSASSLKGLADEFSDLSISSFIVEENSYVVGKNLQELALPKNHALTILAIERSNFTLTTLTPLTLLHAKDTVYLFGSREAIVNGQKLFGANTYLHREHANSPNIEESISPNADEHVENNEDYLDDTMENTEKSIENKKEALQTEEHPKGTPMISLYTKPHCRHSAIVKKYLESQDIEWKEICIANEKSAFDAFYEEKQSVLYRNAEDIEFPIYSDGETVKQGAAEVLAYLMAKNSFGWGITRSNLTGDWIAGLYPSLCPDGLEDTFIDLAERLVEGGLSVCMRIDGRKPELIQELIHKGLVKKLELNFFGTIENYDTINKAKKGLFNLPPKAEEIAESIEIASKFDDSKICLQIIPLNQGGGVYRYLTEEEAKQTAKLIAKCSNDSSLPIKLSVCVGEELIGIGMYNILPEITEAELAMYLQAAREYLPTITAE